MFFKMVLAMRVTHVTPCAFFVHGNQHLQHPSIKLQKSVIQKHWIRWNKMEGDTEDSTVQVWKYKENRVDKQRSLKKKKRYSKEEIEWYTMWK